MGNNVARGKERNGKGNDTFDLSDGGESTFSRILEVDSEDHCESVKNFRCVFCLLDGHGVLLQVLDNLASQIQL